MQPDDLFHRLEGVVGRRHVLTSKASRSWYETGFRYGGGEALAVIRPGRLVELWHVLEICVAANCDVIMQAANTGLTGGSTPAPGQSKRTTIVINTLRINNIILIDDAKQAICFAGSTLYSLEKKLLPHNREPHSVIGSSCLGASVVGGVCNNSGGALVSRGPSYTELSLFAQLGEDGQLRLVNHLDVDLGSTPEEILNRLDTETFTKADAKPTARAASDKEYSARVRDVNSDIPARFNADSRRHFEASGCAGKLAVFAVRLDTFARSDAVTMFYIGTNNPSRLSDIRCEALTNLKHLPVSAEYIHADMYDLAKRYGKDTVFLINALGTNRLPTFFRIKGAFDKWVQGLGFLPDGLSDRMLQAVSRLLPTLLPKRMGQWRKRFEHHLMYKVSSEGLTEATALFERQREQGDIDFFICDDREQKIASLHRFASAGAAIRYTIIHAEDTSRDVLSLDVALRRNDRDWFVLPPKEIAPQIRHSLFYGHFMCNVFHCDYVLTKDADAKLIKHALLQDLDSRGAKYPAEHNVGQLYRAEPDHMNFFRALDPLDKFNPGIGEACARSSADD